MRFSFMHLTSAAVIGLAIAWVGAAPASAESVMAACGAQWKAAKAAGTTNGQTWPQFLSQCRAKGSAAAAPATAPAPAPTTSAPAPAAPATVKTAKECDAEYSANKAAIKASGTKKKDYVANCRAGTTTAAAPAPAPAPTASAAPAPAAPAPAPSIFPWQKAEPQPQATAARPAAPVTASEAQAQASCPSDIVVWLNTKSGIYHFRGNHNYGNTKQGTYTCEASAKAAGDRAAENEKHP
jgi:hypothetical protein